MLTTKTPLSRSEFSQLRFFCGVDKNPKYNRKKWVQNPQGNGYYSYKSIAIVREIVEVFALRNVLLASICLSLLSSCFIILSFSTCPFNDFLCGKSLVNCLHNCKLSFLYVFLLVLKRKMWKQVKGKHMAA